MAKNDKNIDKNADKSKLPESASALHMPKPSFSGIWPVDDLPEAENEQAARLNVRGFEVKPGQDWRDSLAEALSIPQMMDTLLNCSEDELTHPSHALTLARFKKGLPVWVPKELPVGKDNTVLIGGNRRTIAVKRLRKDNPKGIEVELVATDDQGDVTRTKVMRTFESFAVVVYDDLTEEQFRHLQRKEFDRKGLRRGDIAAIGINIFRKDPTLSEAELVNRVGATTFKEFYFSSDPDNPYHTGVQMLRRAAKLPVDIAKAFIDGCNKAGGWTLTDKDLRILMKLYEAEVGFWERRSFNTSKALVKDARWRPSMSTQDIEKLYDTIALEDPEFLGGPDKGEKGSDRSDFLKKVWEMKNVVRGGKKAGTAVSIQDLKGLETGANDTVVLKQLINSEMGKADAIPLADSFDLALEFEVKAIELMQAHEPEWFAAFQAKLTAKIRKRHAEIAKAKADAKSE